MCFGAFAHETNYVKDSTVPTNGRRTDRPNTALMVTHMRVFIGS
jgi:hypothetical protein